MKKLNRKGFTLIELLAIIVILAIIMVVTIPTVLSSMGNARKTTLENSANTVADWIEKEYTMAQIGQGDTAFTAVCGDAGSKCASGLVRAAYVDNSGYKLSDFNTAGVTITDDGNEPSTSGTTTNVVADDGKTKAMLKAAGVDAGNYSKIEITITAGRACVKLTGSDTGDFSTITSTDRVASSTAC